MKDAIELLMEEHRLIEKGLQALGNFVEQLKVGKIKEGKTELARMVEFIQEFADRTHHGKEEKILFEIMVEHGFPKNTGPIAVMLSEHDQGREHVAQLKRFAEQAETWSDKDREKIAQEGLSFTSLLQQHIQKEDNILYPMAKQRLPKDVMEEVTKQCQAFEARESESGENQRLRALGVDLFNRYEKRA